MTITKVWLCVIVFLPASSSVMAANRVIVGSTSVPANVCFTGILNVSIENDVELYSISVPLVLRSTAGVGFLTSIGRRNSTGRLSTSLSGSQVLDISRADFSAPDEVAFYFEAINAGNCLPAGPLQIMTGFDFQTNGIGGTIEVDTAFLPPCYEPLFTACADQLPIQWDEFVNGQINIVDLPPGGCNSLIFFDSTSLTAWAAAELHNDADFVDPERDPMGFRLISGPGSVDSLSGSWIWKNSPADSGSHQVRIGVYDRSCPSAFCPSQTFNVTLKPLVSGDLNCDGIVNIVDVVREVGHTFRAEPPPTPCWDL